ncbi:uncharacterized protein [Typha angustifolia]|uniref:uncharacterized protein n=1 Tax=Typha angustifolia TaxID=59011 RepID=UPI003C2F6720
MGESYTIQISSKLVSQLARDEDKVKRRIKRPKPKISLEHDQSHSKPKQVPAAPQGSSASGWPLQPPIFLPITPEPPPVAIPEVEAIRAIYQESEKVVEKLEKKEAEMLQELTQRAKELHEKEFKLPYQNPLPCTAERENCLHCYKDHTKEPLKCAQAVKAFADCARQARHSSSSTVDP